MKLVSNLRSVVRLYRRLRGRRYHPATILLWLLPMAFWMRIYKKLAYFINDVFLQRYFTSFRFRQFQSRNASLLNGHFYVIVMPQTLHFLLPCLRLISQELRIILLLNGCSRFEAEQLRLRWPAIPQFRMTTMPCSSVGHGAVINMLLENNDADFGLFDHDLYLFDTSILRSLEFEEDQFLICIYNDINPTQGITYPLTHFLYFRTQTFRRLMRQYGVGAQLYRRPPRSTLERLKILGLGGGRTLKSYHDFYDTLHILIALAYAEGLKTKQLAPAEAGVFHVGGTSIGSLLTKDLSDVYIHVRFLDFCNEAMLLPLYRKITRHFSATADMHKDVKYTPVQYRQHLVVDEIFGRFDALESASSRPEP